MNDRSPHLSAGPPEESSGAVDLAAPSSVASPATARQDGSSSTPSRRSAGAHLQAIIVRILTRLLRALPPAATAEAGALAGALYGRLSRRRFAIARENLTRAFGSTMSSSEIERTARAVFRHFGRAAFEMLTMDRFRASDIDRLFHYEGLEHIRSAYQQGRGVFLFSAHYGNWELVALLQGYLGLPLAMVTRPLDNPYLEDDFRRRREASGNRVIGKRSAVRQALKALSEGRGVAIVIDQNVRSGARLFVEFFGRTAATTPTLSLLALKTGAPIVPVFSYPQADGGYRIVYGPEIRVEFTGNRDADVRALTERCTRIIEAQVRTRPDLWLWMHERWKSRPRAGEGP